MASKPISWIFKLVILTIIVLVPVSFQKNWLPLPSTQNKATPADTGDMTDNDAAPVVVAEVYKDEFKTYLYGLGVVTPLNTVDVRSRVDGQLMTISFKEGQIVKAGDLLAEIDPVPFQIQLDLATGQLASDQTLLNTAINDLARYRKLLKQDSISLQLVESKQSLVHQYQAAVQADQGQVTAAKIQLKYAQIKAPISGRVGFRQVDAGNIVRTSDVMGIVSITQLDPISVIFPIPEDDLPRIITLLKAKQTDIVELYDRALKNKIAEGRLVATDNQIDSTTGTIKVKAEFANPDSALFANQFVNVKLTVDTDPQAILIPTAAIQHGSPGKFVYRVNQDLTVSVAPVKIRRSQGKVTSIESGVDIGDKLVIQGADRLREGAKIKLIARHDNNTHKR
ncbi:MAG: MdtA/MuxA family multidrug efflux RND transporter periplasmic adaptor subunit [Gammaproteobacteria bacterium]|nr:MdtA/MuxA family multidrug efflux RND transporter periplasmic adaptor subunit [Gammaproteobacteria bacterium]